MRHHSAQPSLERWIDRSPRSGRSSRSRCGRGAHPTLPPGSRGRSCSCCVGVGLIRGSLAAAPRLQTSKTSPEAGAQAFASRRAWARPSVPNRRLAAPAGLRCDEDRTSEAPALLPRQFIAPIRRERSASEAGRRSAATFRPPRRSGTSGDEVTSPASQNGLRLREVCGGVGGTTDDTLSAGTDNPDQ